MTIGHHEQAPARLAANRLVMMLLVALATVIALVGVTDGSAHWLFHPRSEIGRCLVSNDPNTGVRGVPGSACVGNSVESQPVAYRFNDCGFRTPQPCRPAPPGVFRIVMIGSSFNFGQHVEQSQGFAALLGPTLSDNLQRPVDVFNESMSRGFPSTWALRTDTLLQPRPDMILWPLTPYDIVPNLGPLGEQSRSSGGLFSAPAQAWRTAMAKLSMSTAGIMFQHFLFRSQSQFLSHATANASADYLRVPPPAALQSNLAGFARSFRIVAARAAAAHVPLVVTLLPSREQAIMLSNRTWDKGYDPNQLGRLLRPIVEGAGARYVDMTPGLGSIADAGQDYFPVDEHATAQGHRMFATLLGHALVRSGMLSMSPSDQPVLSHGR